jgi:hypothetical protein
MLATQVISHQADYITRQLAQCRVLPCDTRFAGRLRELKNTHKPVTVKNRTHVYMNFLSQRPRKSSAVVSTRYGSHCIVLHSVGTT